MVAMISGPALNIKPHTYTKTHETLRIFLCMLKEGDKLHVLLIFKNYTASGIQNDAVRKSQ